MSSGTDFFGIGPAFTTQYCLQAAHVIFKSPLTKELTILQKPARDGAL